ncbi:MAG: hypothetical protein ABH879_09450 [archaeon]
MKREYDLMLFVLLLAACIIAVPDIVRQVRYDGLLMGDEAYYHARLSANPADQLMGRPMSLNPYHYVLRGFSHVFGRVASQVLQFVLGLASLMLYNSLLKRAALDAPLRYASAFFVIVSPAFIYLYVTSNAFALAIFAIMLALYLYETSYAVSLLFYALLPFFGWIPSGVAAVVTVSWAIHQRNFRKLILPLVAIGLAGVFLALPGYMAGPVNIVEKDLVKELITGLGAHIGFAVFTLLLSIWGLARAWKTKTRPIGIYVLIILLLAGSYGSEMIPYLIYILAPFSAFAFLRIIGMNWNLKLIRNLTVVALVTGIFYSSLIYADRQVSAEPHPGAADALSWLRGNSAESDVVLSHYSNGYLIEYFAERRPVMDSLFSAEPDVFVRYNDSQEIFYSRNLENTRADLDRYGITHIFIDQAMLDGQVWTDSEEGLLFLFRNNDTFQVAYNSSEAQIWKIRR